MEEAWHGESVGELLHLNSVEAGTYVELIRDEHVALWVAHEECNSDDDGLCRESQSVIAQGLKLLEPQDAPDGSRSSLG